MKRGALRDTLLTTGSVAALLIAGQYPIVAAPCAFTNQSPPINNTTPNNCITFNSGAVFTGDVTNNSTLTAPGPSFRTGTHTGISVLAGSRLVGNVTNSGAITAGAGFVVVQSSVSGSLINNKSISATKEGILVTEANASFAGPIGGSVINSGSIVSGSAGIAVFHSTVVGSVSNAGTITGGIGVVVEFASVGGSVGNGGTIVTSAYTGLGVVNGGEVAGDIVNTGVINNTSPLVNVPIYVGEQSVGGSVINGAGGTISGGYGIAITGSSAAGHPAIVAGNIVNAGTISANLRTGIALSVTVGGAILNSGTITAARNGIRIVNTTGAVGGASVAGGVTNTGTITSTGAGFAGIALIGASISKGVSNAGTISAAGAGISVDGGEILNGRVGIRVAGTTASTPGPASLIPSGLNNSGLIAAKSCIVIGGGAVVGAITNSGHMTCGTAAIDVTGEGAATTINQAGGSITGPILLSALGDIVNVTGGTINGNIVGTGASGTVNFTLGAGNTFTYAAPFGLSGVNQVNINSGTVVLNGVNSAVDVAVNNGGTLAGTGTVNAAVSINSGATLAPGPPGSIGTFSINGGLSFASGSMYAVLLGAGAGNNSLTTVNGSANLAGNGTVVATLLPGRHEQTYRILDTTGGVIGQFAGLTITGDFVGTASLNYTMNAGDIDFIVNGVDLIATPPGANVNQQNVLNAINNAILNSPDNSPIPPQFDALATLSGPALLGALSQLSGEVATGAERGAFNLMNQFLNLMLDPSASCGIADNCGEPRAIGFASGQQASLPPDIALAYNAVFKASPKPAPTFQQRWTGWAAGFGGAATANGNPIIGSNNVRTGTFGYAAGMDYHYSPGTEVGFALAGGGTSWNLAQALGTGRSDAFLAGIHAETRQGPIYLAGALAFANNWFSTDRTALGDQLTADFQGQSYAARLEGGYSFAVPVAHNAFGITPYAAIQAQNFHTPSYSETDLTAGGFGLTYAAMNGTDTRGELGSRFDDLTTFNTLPLILRARVAWAHDWVSNPALNAAFQTLPGASFTVFGAPIPRDSALTSASAQLFIRPSWSFLAKFDGEFAAGSQTYAGTGTLRYTW
jgi:uncharacterized protein with beta-barrel porin domain